MENILSGIRENQYIANLVNGFPIDTTTMNPSSLKKWGRSLMKPMEKIAINCKAILDELKVGKFSKADLEFLRSFFGEILKVTTEKCGGGV